MTYTEALDAASLQYGTRKARLHYVSREGKLASTLLIRIEASPDRKHHFGSSFPPGFTEEDMWASDEWVPVLVENEA